MNAPAPRFLPERAAWPLIVGCAAPLALICVCIGLYGVDVLFWDEFIMWARLLEAMERHGLRLVDLFAQQNEQRNAVARIVGLALLPWFRLARLPELYVIVLLSGLGWLALCGLYTRTRLRFNIQGQRWVYACFAWLTFSTVQWQVFTVGVNTAIVTAVICLLAGAWLLAGPPGPLRFLLALVLGYAGSFNFANGLFYWICLPLVLLAQDLPRRHRLARLAVWILAGAGAWVLYFHGYVKPGHHPSLGYGLTHPHVFIAFFLTYLGGPLAMDNLPFLVALTLGLGGVVFLVINLARCRRAGLRLFPGLAPWAAVLCFALLSDLATSVGRAGFGIQQQALQSRYAAFANLFWFVAVLVAVLARGARAGDQSSPSRQWLRRAQQVFWGLCLACFFVSSVMSVLVMRHRCAKLQTGRAALFELTDDARLHYIFPDPQYLKRMLPLFFQRHLSVFRDIHDLKDYVRLHGERTAGALHWAQVRDPQGPDGSQDSPSGVLLRGWARDPVSNQAARRVLIVADDRLVYVGRTGRPAPEEAAEAPKNSGFELFLPTDYFPGPSVRLELFALLDDERIALLDMRPGPVLRLPAPYYPPGGVEHFFFCGGSLPFPSTGAENDHAR